MVMEGKSREEIARLSGMDRQTLRPTSLLAKASHLYGTAATTML
jgi:hypothetical protein